MLALKITKGLLAAGYPESGAKLVLKVGLQAVITVPELVFSAVLNIYPPHIFAMIAYAAVFSLIPYILSIILAYRVEQHILIPD